MCTIIRHVFSCGNGSSKVAYVVTSTFSHLQILNLSACKNLADSCLDALYKEHALPSLRELDLSYSSVGQTAISHLLSCCTNLVHLNLNGCTNLRDLVWGSSNSHSCEDLVEICPSNSITKENEHLLEVLNCTGCSKLEKVFIPSMSNCFHLSKLSLKLSVNLREVDLTCCALRTLNLRLEFFRTFFYLYLGS